MVKTLAKYFTSDVLALGYINEQLNVFNNSTTVNDDEMFLYRDNKYLKKCQKGSVQKSVTMMRTSLLATFIKYHDQ